jgi:EAL domain-containing protein (putative c-di-GMP-specific phosphodiesterase class I)/ActR/RegA family two-component response regulator
MPFSRAAPSEPSKTDLGPLPKSAAIPLAAQDESAPAISDGDRLLVVEHEPIVSGLVKHAAEGVGFEVILTGDASVVLKTARDWKPTVLMLDLRAIGTDGIELLRGLAEDRCTAHVILISGLDGKTMESAMQLGRERGLQMSGLLHKPVQLETLRELLVRFKSQTTRLSSELASAIETDELFLEYQLKFDCRLKRMVGVEGLVRWKHPALGTLYPDRFIPLAEETDLIHRLTDWVVLAAAKQMAAWHVDNPTLEMAVNISAKNVHVLAFPDRLHEIFQAAGIDCGSITLELTETGAMREPVQMMDVLTRLRLKGFKLSLDDFGTGFSSMIQLQKMPFSEVKIDRSFVMQMMSNEGCRVIVEILIDLARKLGLRSVAEGVEDEATLRCLMGLGCDGAQGYYLARPVATERIPAFVCDYQLMGGGVKAPSTELLSPLTNAWAWRRRRAPARQSSMSSPA